MKLFNYLLTALLALNLVQVNAQCNVAGSHYTSTASGWDPVVDLGDGVGNPSAGCGDGRNGNIFPWGTAVHFNTARGSRDLRLSRNIPVLSDQTWTMDFTLRITAPPGGWGLVNNSPSVTLASVTADKNGIVTGCNIGGDFCVSCGNYPNTDMDAIWVSLTSDDPTDCHDFQSESGKNWRIIARARDGSATPISSVPISITSGTIGTYYIRLQRTGSGTAMVSVCSNANYSTNLPGSPQCFTIPGSVTGLDCLNHEVHAEGFCKRVFNGNVDYLKIDNSLPCAPALYPSFTMASTICQGQPVVVNGSASWGSSMAPANHIWIAEECDAAGNSIGGPIWWGPWVSGAPTSNYTLPYASMAAAGLNVTCGKYYRVSLAMQNCAVSWASQTKVIYINCPPSIRPGADDIICQGESTYLDAGIRSGGSNLTVKWESIEPTHQVIYNGAPAAVMVTPSVTTTYQVTVTDNATGCSSTGQVTVTVLNHDPSFNLTLNTSNANYFTLSMVANDLNGYGNSGFWYALAIEELNGGGSPYYAFGGTNCWWNYPNPETYLGFVSTGTGTYTPSPSAPSCGSTPGKFLYNHTYRITRGVQNDNCPYRQVSVIITPVKSGNGYAMEITEDPDAPDMSAQLMAHRSPVMKDNITIFPNPSTGIFTIELEEEADGSLIEVTNALGQKVKSFEAKGTRSELNLTGFTKGIYIVTIVSNGNTTTKKIILE